MTRVCVVGLGYVGLPLGIAFDRAGYDVVGYDEDEGKVDSMDRGTDPTCEVGDDAVARSDISFTADASAIEANEYYVIAVPTPVDESSRPDLSAVEAAGEMVGRALREGDAVVLESTVYPGATREVLVPALSRTSRLTPGREFHVGYSPERVVPGDPTRGLEDVVKVISGHDETALERLRDLYGGVVDAGLYPAPSLETAEAAKCLENIQRDVNIALVNEFAMGAERADFAVDPREVVRTASTKWNFQEYRPGLVGGHCIPVDPYYVIWALERDGFQPDVMRSARETNDRVGEHVAGLVSDALAERNRNLEQLSPVAARGNDWLVAAEPESTPRLLLLGLAYKPDMNDVRSPVHGDLVERLRRLDVEVVGHDPHVPDRKISAEFGIPTLAELSGVDAGAVVVATGHEAYASLDLDTLRQELDELPVLVDATGTYDREEASDHGFIYRGL